MLNRGDPELASYEPERLPFIIEVVDRADRLLRKEMAQAAVTFGFPEIRPATAAPPKLPTGGWARA